MNTTVLDFDWLLLIKEIWLLLIAITACALMLFTELYILKDFWIPWLGDSIKRSLAKFKRLLAKFKRLLDIWS